MMQNSPDDEQTGKGLLGVHSKQLRSGCRISKRMRLEAEVEKDDQRVDPGGWMANNYW